MANDGELNFVTVQVFMLPVLCVHSNPSTYRPIASDGPASWAARMPRLCTLLSSFPVIRNDNDYEISSVLCSIYCSLRVSLPLQVSQFTAQH